MKNRKSKLPLLSGSPVRLFVLGLSVLYTSAIPVASYAQEEDPLADFEAEAEVEADASADAAAEPETPTDEAAAPSDEKLDTMPSLDPDQPEEDPFAFEDEDGLEGFQKTSKQLEDEFRKGAFQAALDKILPLRPDEIRTLLERHDRTVESVQLPVHPYPRAETVVQNVSIDPGSAPLVVKLAFGYVTTINMVDSTGAPWPFEDVSWVGNFEVHGDTVKDLTHVIRISPSTEFSHGNISVRMVGLDTPIVFTLETNRDFVYYRFDATLPGNGPFASAPLMQPGITLASGDVDMSAALSGVMPEGAVKLSVSGADGRTSAFKYNNYTYVRTPLTLLSPGWQSSVASADGTKVYALTEAPVLLLSDKGRTVRAYLTEREEVLDE